MRGASVICGLAAAMALAGCSPGVNKSVAYSSDLVVTMLGNMTPQNDLIPMARLFPNTDYRVNQGGDTVSWVFLQNGSEACRFTAKVTAKDAKTSQVTTSLDDLSKGGERYLCNVAKIVGEESVASSLEGRPADKEKVKSQLARYMVSDFAAMSESVSKQMTEMAPPRTNPCDNMPNERRDACNTAQAIREQEHARTQAELDKRGFGR